MALSMAVYMANGKSRISSSSNFQLLNLSIINSANMSGKPRKVMVPPINLIFKLLQTHAPVQIWLYEQVDFRIEGKIRVSCSILLFVGSANV